MRVRGASHRMRQVVRELLAVVVPVAAQVRHRLEPVGQKGPAQFASGLRLLEPEEMLHDSEANGLPEGGAKTDTISRTDRRTLSLCRGDR